MLVRQVRQAHQVQLGILTRRHHHGHHHRQLAVLRQLRRVRLLKRHSLNGGRNSRQSPSRPQELRRMLLSFRILINCFQTYQ